MRSLGTREPEAAAPLLPSRLADLGRVPLGEMQAAGAAALAETLERVLPAPEAAQIPVASFNSGI